MNSARPISPLDNRPCPAKSGFVIIFRSEEPLVWGGLDLPLLGIPRDWSGATAHPAPCYCLAMDQARLWFLAHHRRPANLHAGARPGGFLEGLWNHDVAELFLAHPESGRYLEFNLASNAAWWMCEFTAPRTRHPSGPMPEVATFAELAADGSWLAAMAIPLDLLRARIGFAETTRANVTMILESPAQRFYTATSLPGDTPDFHQPEHFAPVRFAPVGNILPDGPPDLESP